MTAFISDPICQQHRPGEGHPERPERWKAVHDALASEKLSRRPPLAPSEEDLTAVHPAAYLELVQQEIASGAELLSTGDTSLGGKSWEAALAAAGCALAGVEAVLKGETANAFCLVRPPGHHASAARGMGFCLLNNVALAARFAQRRHGLERVAIVDWDVHHGNGTQDIFYSDPTVFFFSTHQSPWYPGTGRASERGAGRGEGTTFNCPLPAGSGRSEILTAFQDGWSAAMDRFRPQLILISAGFDSREGDPLGQFTLNDQDFFDLTKLVLGVAERHAESRVVSVLEGGYHLAGLASAAQAHVRALSGGTL